MGDELSGLLEIFTKVKEAGGQATLTAATHEGKTNIKLEIVSPPPATAPPPLQPVPGQRRCRHRGAAARAKGCWPPGDYLGSASTCLPILCPSCSRRSQWPSWPPTAAWPPPSSVSPSLPHLPPLPISVQRAEQGHVSGEAAISAMEQGHVSDEAAISAIIWQPQYWRPPPFPTTWTSPTSPSSSCLHTVDKHKLESESSTLGWHVLWTHLDVWLWNSKHCRGRDRSCERKEELEFCEVMLLRLPLNILLAHMPIVLQLSFPQMGAQTRSTTWMSALSDQLSSRDKTDAPWLCPQLVTCLKCPKMEKKLYILRNFVIILCQCWHVVSTMS